MPEKARTEAVVQCMDCNGLLNWEFTQTREDQTKMCFTCDNCQMINEFTYTLENGLVWVCYEMPF